MEDAHLIYMRGDVGVFGVYDGHGGKDCSKFVARVFAELLDKNGVPEDDAEAVKWFRKAADQGDAHAQYNVGVMYGREHVPMCLMHLCSERSS